MKKQLTDRLAELVSSFAETDESDRRFRLLADSIPQIIWTAGPDGRNDYVNERWYTYTGLTFEQALGWGWTRAIHPDDVQRAFDGWTKAIESGEGFEVEYRWKRASDATWRWHLGRALPVKDSRGNIVEWFGTATEIDDQKSKSEFLSGIGEKVRAPINTIIGFAQLMAAETPQPTSSQRNCIDEILRAGLHLSNLVTEVIDPEATNSQDVREIGTEPVSTSATPGRGEGTLHTILYINNGPANLNLIEQFLSDRTDMRLLTAMTDLRGIERAFAALPDVIVIDIQDSDTIGNEILRILRQVPITASIPVVAISTGGISCDVDTGQSKGFFRKLTAPIQCANFMETLNAALEYPK